MPASQIAPVFLLVPALDDSGPVRGAIALANGLAEHMPVRLVGLKSRPMIAAMIDPRVGVVSLAHEAGMAGRIAAYRRMLREARDERKPLSISFCFSADAANALMGKDARIVSSVRGNLPRNYRYDYGLAGMLLAIAHLMILRRFQTVVVMTASMERQFARWGFRRLVRIGNFVDEVALSSARQSPRAAAAPCRFAFVGGLNRRKRVDLILRAFGDLLRASEDVRLDVIGDGPLRGRLEDQARALGVAMAVTFHGHVERPGALLRRPIFWCFRRNPRASPGRCSRRCSSACRVSCAMSMAMQR